ncbi:hypothetical protein ACGYK7_18020, partial [Sulfitobacter sp. 1A15299]
PTAPHEGRGRHQKRYQKLHLSLGQDPILHGQVYYVSADAILDRAQEVPQEIYVARVSVPPQELDRVRGFKPTPGMPAEIMITTQDRTFIQYLMKPVTDSMIRAFREQ